MSGIFGMNIKMAIYGESHGKSIGVVLDGLPPGLALDEAAIAAEMARRAPGQNALSTARFGSCTAFWTNFPIAWCWQTTTSGCRTCRWISPIRMRALRRPKRRGTTA